ncbi:AraC family transcriptional regulator [Devosia geojensis]|uniref:NADP-dependent 3-hydroxy acid dehydrogenase YdfG n=1 Tax=Devosia geojensis TaxID=443610 RepID=A0A0F5FXZ1_9HYPH|nr:SDR family oxidoreductase [Devosia geojensis]KKB13693.1 AraC family transcriptional regulator [Devosia geojensis]
MAGNFKPVAVVTGASSGIGAGYARRLAARGYDLALVARRVERLELLARELGEAHGTQVEVIGADLGQEADIARIEQWLAGNPAVTMLVNNAGTSRMGGTGALTDADVAAMLTINVTALTRLTRAVLPGFVARNEGAVVNIASALALHSLPLVSIYSGTKAYVLGFSRGLQEEVAGTNVRVQVVLPAAVATEIYDGTILPLEQLPPEIVMSVDDMVDASLAGLDRGEGITLPSVADGALWDAYDAARFELFTATQNGTPAARYKSGQAA